MGGHSVLKIIKSLCSRNRGKLLKYEIRLQVSHGLWIGVIVHMLTE